MSTSQPRLKRHFALVAHDPNNVEIRNGAWNVVSYTLSDEKKTGKLFALLDGLDGESSPVDIAKREGVSRSDIEALIDHLVQLGVVEFGPTTSFDYYLDQIASPLTFHGQPSQATREIALIGDDSLGRQIRELIADTMTTARFVDDARLAPLKALLAQPDTSWLFDGLALEHKMASVAHLAGNFVIFADRSIHPVRLQVMNRVALRHGIPWMPAAVDGPQLLIGPIVDPPHTACFECFETRMLMNARETAPYVAYKRMLAKGAVRPEGRRMDKVLGTMTAAHTGLEALNFLLTGTSFTRGKVLGIYLPTMEVSFNEVLQVPGCAGCAPASETSEEELHFDMRSLVRS
jgi:bacteriocin biosynthesis cyclodehydratase domain-containing protein